jgi:hypothetical protein
MIWHKTKMTLFCIWVGTDDDDIRATPPPSPKKSQQLALGMPKDCGTDYANTFAI